MYDGAVSYCSLTVQNIIMRICVNSFRVLALLLTSVHAHTHTRTQENSSCILFCGTALVRCFIYEYNTAQFVMAQKDKAYSRWLILLCRVKGLRQISFGLGVRN